MSDFSTRIVLMLFEAGGLCADLPAHQSGAALAANIVQAAEAAQDAGQAHFTLELSPTDVGMALSAASGSQSPLSQTVADKLRVALAAKLQELGIQYPEQDNQAGDPNDFWAQDPSETAPSDNGEGDNSGGVL